MEILVGPAPSRTKSIHHVIVQMYTRSLKISFRTSFLSSKSVAIFLMLRYVLLLFLLSDRPDDMYVPLFTIVRDQILLSRDSEY